MLRESGLSQLKIPKPVCDMQNRNVGTLLRVLPGTHLASQAHQRILFATGSPAAREVFDIYYLPSNRSVPLVCKPGSAGLQATPEALASTFRAGWETR